MLRRITAIFCDVQFCPSAAFLPYEASKDQVEAELYGRYGWIIRQPTPTDVVHICNKCKASFQDDQKKEDAV